MTSLHPGTAIVIGASGQDGYFLTRSLLAEGKLVHAIMRRPEARNELSTLRHASTTMHVHELRPADPVEISVDSSRARRELGWAPRTGLEVFLYDMLDGKAEHKNVD